MSDLISRQAAIDAIYNVYDKYDRNAKVEELTSAIQWLPSAQPEHLTDDDFETIRIHLSAFKERLCNQHRWKEAEEYQRIIDRFMSFASAQPEPQWIPCSERLPKEYEWMGTKRFGTTISDEVYVTFENPKGERFCKHLSFQNGKLSSFDQSTIDAFYKGSKPIAWMPLPEPWRGEEHD